MAVSNSNSKSDLRKKIGAARGKISLAVREAESIDLRARLEPQLQSARAILFHAPLPDELDIWPLLEKCLAAGKVCALPFYNSITKNYLARRVRNLAEDVSVGFYGIREPNTGCPEVPPEQFDLVLVPGVAFDFSGNRLGRGKGFYDRLLKPFSGLKCGVCHDFQLLEKIPSEPHDVRMNFVVTPMRCVKCGS